MSPDLHDFLDRSGGAMEMRLSRKQCLLIPCIDSSLSKMPSLLYTYEFTIQI